MLAAGLAGRFGIRSRCWADVGGGGGRPASCPDRLALPMQAFLPRLARPQPHRFCSRRVPAALVPCPSGLPDTSPGAAGALPARPCPECWRPWCGPTHPGGPSAHDHPRRFSRHAQSASAKAVSWALPCCWRGCDWAWRNFPINGSLNLLPAPRLLAPAGADGAFKPLPGGAGFRCLPPWPFGLLAWRPLLLARGGGPQLACWIFQDADTDAELIAQSPNLLAQAPAGAFAPVGTYPSRRAERGQRNPPQPPSALRSCWPCAAGSRPLPAAAAAPHCRYRGGAGLRCLPFNHPCWGPPTRSKNSAPCLGFQLRCPPCCWRHRHPGQFRSWDNPTAWPKVAAAAWRLSAALQLLSVCAALIGVPAVAPAGSLRPRLGSLLRSHLVPARGHRSVVRPLRGQVGRHQPLKRRLARSRPALAARADMPWWAKCAALLGPLPEYRDRRSGRPDARNR